MSQLLKCENMVSGYGDTQILWGVNLTVYNEEIVSIIGPNGAGKSTLLKTIAGLINLWQGRIVYNGIDISRYPAYRRAKLGIVLVPEGRALFGDMNVYENLLMGIHAIPKHERRLEMIQESLEIVYSLFPVLKERVNQKAKTLSGGEQQMLAIARALMSRPKLLLLDEPTQGLSPKLALEVMKTIVKMRNELKLTIIVVEERIKHALEVSDKVYVMNEGRITHEIPRESFSKEESFLKSFLGV